MIELQSTKNSSCTINGKFSHNSKTKRETLKLIEITKNKYCQKQKKMYLREPRKELLQSLISVVWF